MDEIRGLMAQQQAQMAQLQLNLQQPTNAGNDLAFQLAQILRMGPSNTDPREKEENRLVKLSETHWRKHTPLQGRSNFAEWKSNMLIDADYLNAHNILVKTIQMRKCHNSHGMYAVNYSTPEFRTDYLQKSPKPFRPVAYWTHQRYCIDWRFCTAYQRQKDDFF